MKEIKNAQIEYTKLGYEDHGIFTCYIGLIYSGGGQTFGGYVLNEFTKEFIEGILAVVKVDNWENLVGKFIRVEKDYTKIYRIINLLDDNLYLDPSDVFNK